MSALIDNDSTSPLQRFGSPDPQLVEALRAQACAMPACHDPGTTALELEEYLLYVLFFGTPQQFAEAVDEHRDRIDAACWEREPLRQLVLTGLQMGIQQECAECANELGALYYGGSIVEQNFEITRDLYQLAMNLGSVQATINLGYIYEYGRTGAPDPVQAYRCYSLAAVLAGAPEALYKMGDLLSRDNGLGPRDIRLAYLMWTKSLEAAIEQQDLENQAQAAFRLAPYHLDPDKGETVGAVYDPLQALQLYQLAEVGLWLSIKHGLTYYAKRLQQTLEGQNRAREAFV